MISINISDLIWTIINFLLFCFLLNHFLFKPVLRFMDDRQARVDAKLSEKREAEALAEENDARIESEKEKSRDEAKRILSKADSDSRPDASGTRGRRPGSQGCRGGSGSAPRENRGNAQ